MIDKEERFKANSKHSAALSSQGLSESSDDIPSLMSGSNDSVDISGQFRAMKMQMADMKQPQLEEVKESTLEESAQREKEDEEKFFEELEQDMVDEGVSVASMSGFSLTKQTKSQKV